MFHTPPNAAPVDASGSLARRAVVGVVVGGIIVASSAVLWVDAKVRRPACTSLEGGHLTVHELAALKHKVDAHRSEGGSMVLETDELEYLLRSAAVKEASFEVDGDRVRVGLGVPAVAGCYDVQLEGALAISQGELVVEADALRVGDLDLSWWVRSQPLSLDHQAMPNAFSADLIAGVDRLVVADGEVTCTMSGSWTPRL